MRSEALFQRGARATRLRTTPGRRLAFEPLEPRLALDSTVVFNEILYNPLDAEEDLEWVELHSQMAVDTDLSGWRLDGAVEFEFSEGTILAGGGYLVIAAAPDRLEAATGFADALGPFTGQLSNGGEEIVLYDNNRRLMDVVQYDDQAPWPAAADGSGASLAKIDPDTTGEPAESWTFSPQVGGTPGRQNFPDPNSPPEIATLVELDAAWSYEASGTDLGTSWRGTGYDDSGWDTDPAPFYAEAAKRDVKVDYSINAHITADNFFAVYIGEADGTNLRLIGRDRISDWTSVEYFSNVQVGPNEHVYVAAWEAPGNDGGPQMLIGQFDLPDGTQLGTRVAGWEYVLGPTGASPGGSLSDPPPAVADLQTLVAGAAWAAPQVELDRFASPWGGAVGGSFDASARYVWADTFASNSLTNINNTYALFRSAEPVLPAAGNTELPLGPTTYYFRSEFDYYDDPGRTDLLLDTLIDDGAVFYLNGDEIRRQNMPPGSVTYDTLASSEVDEASFVHYSDLPTGSLVQGTNLLAVEVHQAVADDADMFFGVELSARVWPPDPQQTEKLTFNEVAAATETPFWLELANSGDVPLQLAGYTIADSAGNQYTLPEQSLEPGGFLPVTEAELGFAPALGDRLFLYTPGGDTLLDGVRMDGLLRGRSPDGTGDWLYPDAATPDGANRFAWHDEIVINEIMYHHRPTSALPGDPWEESDEEWIELYNRSGTTVDLSGWELTDGIEYQFEPDTTIAPGDYLVVAKEAAGLGTTYPTIRIVGDFSRRLADQSDRIVLNDENGNPVDEVHYYEGGRWPGFADGGGPSLELRDPEADNSSPEAWAPSDEGSRSAWQTYSYRGIAQASSVGPDGQWREFVLGLLDGGEVLLDDLHVIEYPDGAATELLQNGTFDSSTAYAWRLLGNHRHSRVIVDPDDPGNYVLRLVATGPTEHMHNHAETTLADGRSIVNGREYEISFRAKWITGSNQVHTRLYFNRLPHTTLVQQPELHGTPGAQNSTYEANIGPTYREFRHDLAVPAPNEPVTVSVIAEDPDQVANMTLWYAVAGGGFSSIAMGHQGGGLYQADVPGQAAATIVQFYVEGEDSRGAGSTFPAAGRDSRALYKVDDGLAATNGLHNFRIIMTPNDADWLHTDVNLMSNDPVGATVIYKEQEVFYDVGVRLKGSERGRVTVPRLGFGVYFNADELFRGVHRSVLIDRSHSTEFGQREMLINQTMNHAGGLPGEYNDLIQVISPRLEHTGSAELQLARYTDVFLDSQFDNGGEEMLYEYELIYYPTTTNNGTPEGLKLPQPDSVVGTGIHDLGDDKEAYRWNFIIKNNRDADDYAPWIEFAKVFGLSGAAFYDRIDGMIDVDQWLRAFALATLSGAGDNYAQGAQHNAEFYVRPDDRQVLYFPHDLDAFYSATRPVVGNSDLSKLISVQPNARLYYGHLHDIISTSYNGTYMSYWTDHYGSLLPGQDFPGYQAFIEQRSNYVLSAVMNFTPQVPFEVTTNGGNDFSVDDVVATIEGRGWINVREIRLEGSEDPLEVIWTDKDSWRVTVPLAAGANLLTFQAYDFQQELIGTDSITVTSTVIHRPLQDFLRITELNYNPYELTAAEEDAGFTDKEQFEFIELQNVGDETLDLDGVRFTDGVTFEFTGDTQGSPLVITEMGTAYDDFVEIQNVSTSTIDTAGWRMAINDPTDEQINDMHSVWSFPASMASDEVLYLDDDEDGGHYWGEPIRWTTTKPGWVMIVDDAGAVVDFLVWGYTTEDIASLSLNVGGFDVTAAGVWSGESVSVGGSSLITHQRVGNSDHDSSADWALASPPSKGSPNTGLTTPFAGEIKLAPGEFVVVAKNETALAARYGTAINVAGCYDDNLRNSGERITLEGPAGQMVILDFEYGDSNDAEWPNRPDGDGSSLVVIDPGGDYGDPDNWRAGIRYGGTPGAAAVPTSVVINEVLTHTDDPWTDAIELHNTADVALEIGGWWLSDSDGDYRKFEIPAGTTVPAGGYAVFYEGHYVDHVMCFDDDEFGGPGEKDFALNGAEGDDVWLTRYEDGRLIDFIDHAEFGAAAEGESWGRWPNGEGRPYPMLTPTLNPENGPNGSPRVGPVIISEVHYNPELGEDDEDLEFIEIYNTTQATIDLTEWRIRKGIDYDFPAETLLPPYSPLVIVPFNLSDSDRWSAFCAEYGLDVEDTEGFLGGYSGQLSDGGETVQLQRPDTPDQQGFVPRLLEDEVRYEDHAPWPIDADGNGQSLHRADTNLWGNAPASWNDLVPTPGQEPFQIPASGQVVGRHVFYNRSKFDGDSAAADARDDGAIAPDKVALLPGETATLANYTSYSRGINGIVIDVARMQQGVVPERDDFRFRVGNTNTPGDWAAAPTPSVITVRPGAGAEGSDRITLIWPDNAIQKQWLQVTVLTTDTTRLAEQDVFYFGSAIGETGNSTVDAKVNAFDMLGARDNQRTFINPASIDFPCDFNRDARVNTYDMLIARDNQTHFLNALKLITAPQSKADDEATTVGKAAARDAVLDQIAPSEACRRVDWPAELDWLYEFEPMDAAQRGSSKDTPASTAVDRLLTTSCP